MATAVDFDNRKYAPINESRLIDSNFWNDQMTSPLTGFVDLKY
jgi:hypothetical protein